MTLEERVARLELEIEHVERVQGLIAVALLIVTVIFVFMVFAQVAGAEAAGPQTQPAQAPPPVSGYVAFVGEDCSVLIWVLTVSPEKQSIAANTSLKVYIQDGGQEFEKRFRFSQEALENGAFGTGGFEFMPPFVGQTWVYAEVQLEGIPQGEPIQFVQECVPPSPPPLP